MARTSLFLALALALLPFGALAQSAPPPDAAEFTTAAPELAGSVTVSPPAPVAGMPIDTEEETINMAREQQDMDTEPAPENAPFASSAEAPPSYTATPPPPPEPAEEPPPPTNTVVLQGLNKVTGHISQLSGPIGTVLTFDNLEIITRRCWKSPPEDRPENAALLEIRELKIGEEPKQVFMGWMFSSSPGLSGLEHAVYDITVKACEFRENPEEADEKTEEKPAGKSKPASKGKKDQH